MSRPRFRRRSPFRSSWTGRPFSATAAWSSAFDESTPRRLLAGLAEVPAAVHALTDLQVDEIQQIKNLQRRDLDPIEEAAGYQRLVDEHGYTADQVVSQFGNYILDSR